MTRASSAILILLAACGPSISSTKAPVGVPGAGTYAWGGIAALPPTAEGYALANQRLQLRIKQSIDTALMAKGYKRVDSASAAFLVRYAVGVKTTSANAPVTNPGPDAVVPMTSCNAGGCWNGWNYGYTSSSDPAFAGLTEREEGVILEFVDRKTGAIAWHAVYRDNTTGKAPTPERIDKAVAQLTKSLPPAH